MVCLVLDKPTLDELERSFVFLVGEISRHEKPWSTEGRWTVLSGDFLTADGHDLAIDPIRFGLERALKRLGKVVAKLYGPEALGELVFRHSGRRNTKIAGVEFGPDGRAA